MLIRFNRFHICSIIDHKIVSIATVCLIFSQIIQKKKRPVNNLENRLLDFLGKISFGLYVYHPLLIYLLSESMHNHVDFTSSALIVCALVF